MAKCNDCGREMRDKHHQGCTVTHYEFGKGVVLEREKYEGGWDIGTGCCGDCNAPIGTYHHPGCDVERCPRCGLQAIGCPCLDEFDEEAELAPLPV